MPDVVGDGAAVTAELERLRGLLAARAEVDRLVDELVRSVIEAGGDRSQLSAVLGVDRSTLYRRYLRP